ncbi:MAG: hypothetical protein Q8L29_02420 [archaeon]|nr:hypothetical protein [archaeon]
MEKRRVIELLLILVGLSSIMISDTRITGASINAANYTIIGMIGTFVFLLGIVLLIISRKYESELRDIIGDEKYERLSPEEKRTYIKSVRRYEERNENYEDWLKRKKSKLEASAEAHEEIKNEAQDWLNRGYIPEKTKELEGLAKRRGYDLHGGAKEGKYIIIKGRRLPIGKHAKVSRGVARNIIRAVATNEPPARRYGRTA